MTEKDQHSTWPRKLLNQGIAAAFAVGLLCLVELALIVPPLVAGTLSPGQRTAAWVILVGGRVTTVAVAVWYARKATAYIRSPQ